MLLLGGWLLAVTATAQDQATRSLSIRDGEVYIDGQVVPPDRLPPGLDIEGVQVQYTFSGDVRPVVDINGQFFVIEHENLRSAEASEEERAPVFFRQGRTEMGRPAAHRFFIGDAGETAEMSTYVSPHAAGVGKQARELAAQAVQLQKMQLQLDDQVGRRDMEELSRAAERLSRQAEEAARAAEALPMLELQNYLSGIQRHDRELYELLVKEREIERETIRLARAIRAMADGEERDERVEELQRKLDEAFELKQTNRRREIQQLENRLQDLQQKLEERERLRGDIIENRLRELLGLKNEFKW